MGLLSRIVRNRSLRAVAAWGLVVVQAEFLWFGEFHRHDEEQARHGQAVSILDGKQASRGSAPRPSCVACQIGHERAASPEVGRAAIAPAPVNRCAVEIESQHARPSLLATTTPRAPPTV